MCFGRKPKEATDDGAVIPVSKEEMHAQKEAEKKEKERLKMEKGFREMAEANSAATARKCC